MLQRVEQVRAYRSNCDVRQAMKIAEDFQLDVPSLKDAEAAAAMMTTAARRANGVAPLQQTFSSLIPLIEDQNRRLVEQGSMKHKSAKQRIRHMKGSVAQIS